MLIEWLSKKRFLVFGSGSWVDFGAKAPVLKAYKVYVLLRGIARPNESAGCFLIFYSAMCKMRLTLANICLFVCLFFQSED